MFEEFRKEYQSKNPKINKTLNDLATMPSKMNLVQKAKKSVQNTKALIVLDDKECIVVNHYGLESQVYKNLWYLHKRGQVYIFPRMFYAFEDFLKKENRIIKTMEGEWCYFDKIKNVNIKDFDVTYYLSNNRIVKDVFGKVPQIMKIRSLV